MRSRHESKLWTDHIEWADRTSADTAAQVVMTLQQFGPFVGIIEMSSLQMRQANVLRMMGD